MQIKRVLIPTDFSEASMKALKYALFIEEKFDSEIHIAHVMFDESNINTFYMLKKTVSEFMSELGDAVQNNMENFTADTMENISKSVVLKGVPHKEIIKYAEDNNIDLIIIGTYEKSTLDYLIYGSTTEKVIKKSKCPVLVVKI